MILVTGATGFIGGHVLRRASARGWRVRGLARHPDRAGDLARLPHVELFRGDVTDPEDLDEAMEDVTAVLHLVGILAPSSKEAYEAVHVGGTRNVLAAAERAGAKRFLYMSNLGIEEGKRRSPFFRTKAEAEDLVRASPLESTIFRPSIVFGSNHERFDRIVSGIRWSPVIPLPGGGEGRLQPVWVGDVAECFLQAAKAERTPEPDYDVAGPEVMTLRGMVERLARLMGKSRAVVPIPAAVARLGARLAEFLPEPPVTREQLTMLEIPNVADPDRVRALLRDFELEHARLEDKAPEFVREAAQD